MFCFSVSGPGGKYTYSTSSFLFSLKNDLNQQYKMFLYRNYQYAIHRHNERGPIFGGSHDLLIYNNCHTNTNSYSVLGGSYRPPNGYGYGSSQANNFLAGSHNFKCDEYEVFYQV